MPENPKKKGKKGKWKDILRQVGAAAVGGTVAAVAGNQKGVSPASAAAYGIAAGAGSNYAMKQFGLENDERKGQRKADRGARKLAEARMDLAWSKYQPMDKKFRPNTSEPLPEDSPQQKQYDKALPRPKLSKTKFKDPLNKYRF